MKKVRKNTGKWIRRIILGVLVLLVLFVGVVYLLQHFYGEKWLKMYVENTILKESDSLYSIKMDDLSLNVMAGRITIRGFKLIPDTNVYYRLKKKGHVPPFLVSVAVSNFRVRGFDWLHALRDKDISINKIFIDNPEVELTRMALPDTMITDTTRVARSLSLPIPAGLNSVIVRLFQITGGKFTYNDRTKSPLMKIVCPELALVVTNFIQNKETHYTGRIFNSDDISASMAGFSINLPDSLYHFSLGSIGISTKSHAVTLDSVTLSPRYSRKEFFKRLGYQSDRFDLRIRRLGIESIDYPSILLNNILRAGYVKIDGWKVDVYRDKRIPLIPEIVPVLPQVALRKIKALFTIDSVRLNEGHGSYAEQVGPEPGNVFFDQITVLARNVSNDSVFATKNIMEINGNGRLMGKGRVQVRFLMPVFAKNEAFTFSGTISSLDMTDINPMMTKLVPAKIVKGKLERVVIPPVMANNDMAVGTLQFYYHDLSVLLSKENLNFWQGIKAGALNLAANTLIVGENPTKGGKFRTGIIRFERDKSKGIFNYLWKSTFSGLKSTMGVNTKEQRQTKKEERKALRQEKREQKKKGR